MNDINNWVFPPIVQSAIAGIADSRFCQEMLDYCAGMVTLGGYSIDLNSKIATEKIVKRGRKEFLLPENRLKKKQWIEEKIVLNKKNLNQKIAANVRIVKLDDMSMFWLESLQNHVDYIELNAHCRQKEIVNIGGGQALLVNLKNLELIFAEFDKNFPSINYGIKIRGYVVGNVENFIKSIETTNCKYIHIDAMIPGKESADLHLIDKFVKSTKIPIIANNLVRELMQIKQMLSSGVKAVSLARPLIENPLFMKKLTKTYIEDYECQNQ